MLPWGHAALGYLLYSAWRHLRTGRPPGGWAVVGLAVGTQFPDLIDKPLAWTVPVLPSGRSLAHSLVVIVPVTVAVAAAVVLIRRARRDGAPDGHTADAPATPAVAAAGGFAFGWYAHLLGDAYRVVLPGEACVSYLLWPVAPVCGYAESDASILGFFLELTPTPAIVAGLALTAVAVGVWCRDGTPGLAAVRAVAGGVAGAVAERVGNGRP
ncbi:metal-dependent hydrolase [Halobaculum sp. CBA1158]|uniref:metal-dependent hydrolase n=1 Tax=Halobaculum sp. CBA1158 TaxID=2904243 RepID=UPI001F1D20ED|nr:metal-dependent hydrolase [Halobaculum sp. CBA1158]UIO99760.1 metal-dependent hydrolase [Halobaculum sp. CBA1158]